MVVDIPGGSTATVKERTLFFREIPECFQYKFRNPTNRESFEVVPRKTYATPPSEETGEEGETEEGDRLFDEIPAGDWMHKMQVQHIFCFCTLQMLTSFFERHR